jgi:transposase
MPLPTAEQLQDLSRDELIAVILVLMEQVRQLTETVEQLTGTVEQLRAENEQLKHPPTSSQNSSQPPSRDWKADTPTGRRTPRKKRGAQPGHAKAERALVEQPDQVLEVRVTTCTGCGADLQTVTPERVLRRQVTELPILKPVVIETRQHEVCCPVCELRQRGQLPVGLEADRWCGPRLEALVTYLHQVHHVGFERLQTVLLDVFGITLSLGGEVAVVERAGAAAEPEAAAIGEQVRVSAVLQSDETSSRVNGRNYWEWVFVSMAGVYHLIRQSRGQDVIDAFMGERRAEVWLSDCWKPQLNAPAAQHQLCLPHQIRALQGVIDRRPRLRWVREMQSLFRTAIHLNHRRDVLTPRGFRRQVTLLERRLDRLLARHFTGLGANLLERYRTHRAHLFVFLHRTDVPADNNASERALRPSVIHRKVMGSFRSEWGAQAYAALATVLDTAKRKGDNLFQKLVALMGQPILHYLQPSTR